MRLRLSPRVFGQVLRFGVREMWVFEPASQLFVQLESQRRAPMHLRSQAGALK